MKTTVLILIFMLITAVARGDQFRLGVPDESAFFHSIAKVESKSAWAAVGDRHLKYRAHGAYQIRYPAITDVNRVYRKAVLVRWGRLLTPADMHDPEMARWTLRAYLHHYGDVYERRTGRKPDAKVYSRIHNGGPNGWRDRNTLAYWRKVSVYLAGVRTYG